MVRKEIFLRKNKLLLIVIKIQPLLRLLIRLMMILYINGRLFKRIFWAMPILDLIGHLYNDIALTFAKIIFVLDASTTAQIFNHKLTGLDSQGFLQSNLHTSDGMLIVIMIILFFDYVSVL